MSLRRAPRESTERENEEIVTIITDSFFATEICSAEGITFPVAFPNKLQ